MQKYKWYNYFRKPLAIYYRTKHMTMTKKFYMYRHLDRRDWEKKKDLSGYVLRSFNLLGNKVINTNKKRE